MSLFSKSLNIICLVGNKENYIEMFVLLLCSNCLFPFTELAVAPPTWTTMTSKDRYTLVTLSPSSFDYFIVAREFSATAKGKTIVQVLT